jgi:DNA-binding NtrC family response regulator
MPLSAIIVDIGLPDMSGERIIEAAIQHRPQTPVIRCSGTSEQSLASADKVHVFPKPYSATELSKFVASLISPPTA